LLFVSHNLGQAGTYPLGSSLNPEKGRETLQMLTTFQARILLLFAFLAIPRCLIQFQNDLLLLYILVLGLLLLF